MKRSVINFSFALWMAALCGCQTMSWPQFWPFPERERTTYNTPAMRSDAVREFAARSTGTDSPEQRQITDQLARQIQVEPDPLVRQAVIKAIAEFRTPMAQQVLEAGLADQDEMVRVTCCQALGERAATGVADPSYSARSVASLAAVLKSDKDVDVRLAAAQALGSIKTPEAVQALAVALDDRDPALQYVGVQSMKSVTGKDYGPNVEAWRQVAAGQTPTTPEMPSIAERLQPFRRATK
ncbi:MAG: HEAT repeat domain-containing protein [Acidobacteriales bacterium]|nr:HEAT repeat domain-containing protein [Terriglobales bacterium]